MADSDYDAVSPIQSLQTIQSLTPTERRQERRRRQMPEEDPKESDEQMSNEDEESSETPEGPGPRNDGNSHIVDYCA